MLLLFLFDANANMRKLKLKMLDKAKQEGINSHNDDE
jgi:hypothetical protein